MSFYFSLALVIAAGVFVLRMIQIVPQQSVFVVERLGSYHETLTAGLHFLVPFIDRIAYRHSLKEFPYDVDPQVCITHDNTQVQIDGILYYQVTDPKQASYGASNYEQAIEQLAKTTLRSEVGKRDLDKLLEDRDAINKSVVAALDEASSTWGVKVLRYEIKDIVPPESVLRAMQLQITAEREKRAKIAESEGERQKEINLAEGKKQASIALSEGAMTAAINKAKGEAESVKLVAEATSEALLRVAQAVNAPGGAGAVNLKVAEQYVAAFANLAKQGNTLIVPANLGDISTLIASAMFISAASGLEERIKAFELGGVDYLSKPIQAEEVQARVSTHLALYDLRRSLERRAEERARELAATRLRLQDEQRSLVQARQALEEREALIHCLVDSNILGIMFTNHPGFRQRCLDLGADFFFDKTVNLDTLTDTVSRLAKEEVQ